MKSLLIISDPIPNGHSVQLDTIKALASALSSRYRIGVASTHMPPDKAMELEKSGYFVLVPRRQKYRLYEILKKMKRDNESMIWLEAWLREFFLGSNSSEMMHAIKGESIDFVLNLSYPTPYRANLWWNQGPPMYETLKEMSATNSLAKAVSGLARPLIRVIDMKLLRKTSSLSSKAVTSSAYISKMYSEIEIPSDGVVYSCSQAHTFHRSTENPSRDYVLIYISKETDFTPIEKMHEAGMRMIGFGSKIPLGTDINTVRNMVDFRGYVTKDELERLYSNALFTAFPFTTEGLGCVPLESMACGTPVLTYNRQGPAETVLDKRTGWLVHTPDEFSDLAISIWGKGRTGMSPEACIDHAGGFMVNVQSERLVEILENSVV